MDVRPLRTGALVLLLAVLFGAFGAHGLEPRVTPKALAQWKTAVEYQFYHGLGLVLLSVLSAHLQPRTVRMVHGLFLTGIGLFCGSIYLLSTRELLGTQALGPILGPITPLGGLLFMAGWGLLFITALRRGDGR